jgi:hypothetical protein
MTVTATAMLVSYVGRIWRPQRRVPRIPSLLLVALRFRSRPVMVLLRHNSTACVRKVVRDCHGVRADVAIQRPGVGVVPVTVTPVTHACRIRRPQFKDTTPSLPPGFGARRASTPYQVLVLSIHG